MRKITAGLFISLDGVVEAPDGRVVSTVWLNGAPAGRIELDGQLAAVSLVVENGRVTRIFAIANPQKLRRLEQPAALAR